MEVHPQIAATILSDQRTLATYTLPEHQSACRRDVCPNSSQETESGCALGTWYLQIQTSLSFTEHLDPEWQHMRLYLPPQRFHGATYPLSLQFCDVIVMPSAPGLTTRSVQVRKLRAHWKIVGAIPAVKLTTLPAAAQHFGRGTHRFHKQERMQGTMLRRWNPLSYATALRPC